MTKRIFRSICAVTTAAVLAALVVITGVMYRYFTRIEEEHLKLQLTVAVQELQLSDKEDLSLILERPEAESYRVTWMDQAGRVLYDSRPAGVPAESHAEREEMQEALETGFGESRRYSDSEKGFYIYAARRLSDGSVLRLAVSQKTVFSLLWGVLHWVILILAAAVVISFFLASWLSRKIVQPLNNINLDLPLSGQGYAEISLLLQRIDSQQKKLRQQEIELQKKQDEFLAVTENMSEGLILLNDAGVILSINQAAKNWFAGGSDCIGRELSELSSSAQLKKLLQTVLSGRQNEMLLELSGGLYQLDASPVVSEKKLSGAVILMFDITEKKGVEQMRREFTANVSHELKTPLHSISGYAELLCNGMVRKEDVGQFAQKIYIEAQRMIHLVEDIMRLSHLDEGDDSLKWEKADLLRLASEAAGHFEKTAAAQQITLSVTGEPVLFDCVPQLLSVMICNLCDNAVKYNQAGGRVELTVKQDGKEAVLTVRDTGIGIPKEHQERIFERFYRVDKSHSKEVGGTGLGLSIVKHAARIHGAALSLNSFPGKGTVVTARFPLQKAL